MHTHVFTRLLAALTIGTALVSASPALAEMVKMTAMLSGKMEVPPTDSNGKGSVEATFDTDTKKLDWTIEYSDLTGPVTAAHFHGPAESGKNAPPVVPLEGDLASPLKGSATLTDAVAADLAAGRIYFNIHTAAHPDGEIRGQVEKGM
jgi:hypothetical protein